MRKTVIMGSVLVIVLAAVAGVSACDKANAAAQNAYATAIGEGSCAKTAEKAAYDAAYAASGCEKTAAGAAQYAVNHAGGAQGEAKAGCRKTQATQAANDGVVKTADGGCAYDATKAGSGDQWKSRGDAGPGGSASPSSFGACNDRAW